MTRFKMMIILRLTILAAVAVGFPAFPEWSVGSMVGFAADQPLSMMQVPPEERQWFRNPDGSCVQCSIGLTGHHCNCPEATTLLWDTPYGPKVRGGSSPSRVAAYCNSRHIRAYNVTGSNTWEWMKWAAKTGRFAAIGAGGNHFQTLYGRDEGRGIWYVENNNSPQRVDEYNEAAFRRLHLASGQWVVVLKRPSPRYPEYVEWWK